MQGQTQISSVLALKPTSANASADKGRSAMAAQSGEDFRRMLDRPSGGEEVRRSAPERSRESGDNQAQNRDGQIRQDRADQQRRRQSSADQRQTDDSSRLERARDSKQSGQSQRVSEGSETRQSESAPTRSEGIDLDEVDLSDLSDDELKALGAQVEAILSDLRAQLEAGELDADAEEALRDLLLALDEGASVAEITQLLDALPVSLLPEGRIANTNTDTNTKTNTKTLADLLGRSGATLLARLASEANQRGDSGFSFRLMASEEGHSLEWDAEWDKLFTGHKGQGSSSSKETFAQMLQAVSGREGASSRGADSSQIQAQPQTQTPASAVANLEAGVRQPPLQPSERQFMVQSDVRVPVNQGQWGQAVGQRVLWLAAQNVTSAELRLDPPDLGPMQVRVTSHQDQISVTFTSPQVAVREALDQNATRLREMFAEQGLDLVDVNVSDQSDGREMAGEGGQGNRDQAGGDTEGDEADSRMTERIAETYLVDHYV